MYGTVIYFLNCLQANTMNRLVDENADSLNDCYQKLAEEILLSEETDACKKMHANNLEKAYQSVINTISSVEEAVHIDL